MREFAVDLDGLLARADELVAAREPEFVPVVLAGVMVGIRFMPMSGDDWYLLTMKHPPRPDVVQDSRLGYDLRAVVEAFPEVALVVDDVVDDMMRPGPDGELVSVWPKVLSKLTKTGLHDLSTSMWSAHERDPEVRVEAAGKASAGSRKKKRS